MRYLLIFMTLTMPLFGQTFKVCDVERATEPLKTVDRDFLLKTLYGPNVEASGLPPGDYVPSSHIHPFVFAAHSAFDEHRPLIISPDDIWLLIAQGLATHITLNSEEFRERIAGFSGKRELVVRRDHFIKGSADNDWPGVLDEFSLKVNQNSKETLGEFFAPSFTTTTNEINAAYRIAHLDATSRYFSYTLITGCGIPEFTLEGTTADWQEILKRLDRVETFHKEWAASLRVIIKEFIQASTGNADINFWKSFYKYEGGSGQR